MSDDEPRNTVFERQDRAMQQIEERGSYRMRLLASFAPDNFHRWKTWQKFVVAFVVTAILAVLYFGYALIGSDSL